MMNRNHISAEVSSLLLNDTKWSSCKYRIIDTKDLKILRQSLFDQYNDNDITLAELNSLLNEIENRPDHLDTYDYIFDRCQETCLKEDFLDFEAKKINLSELVRKIKNNHDKYRQLGQDAGLFVADNLPYNTIDVADNFNQVLSDGIIVQSIEAIEYEALSLTNYYFNRSNNLKTVKEKLYGFDPSQHGLILAGGMLASVYTEQGYGDLDFFLIGDTDPKEACSQLYLHLSKCNIKHVERNYNTFTINFRDSDHKFCQWQIILRSYANISQVLYGFDINASQIAYDGHKLYFTPGAHLALYHGVVYADSDLWSPSYAGRLCKYSNRGFVIYFPGIEVNEAVNDNIIICQDLALYSAEGYDLFAWSNPKFNGENRDYVDYSKYYGIFNERIDRNHRVFSKVYLITNTKSYSEYLEYKDELPSDGEISFSRNVYLTNGLPTIRCHTYDIDFFEEIGKDLPQIAGFSDFNRGLLHVMFQESYKIDITELIIHVFDLIKRYYISIDKIIGLIGKDLGVKLMTYRINEYDFNTDPDHVRQMITDNISKQYTLEFKLRETTSGCHLYKGKRKVGKTVNEWYRSN